MELPARPIVEGDAVVFRHPIDSAGGAVLEVAVRLVPDSSQRDEDRRAVLEELASMMREAPFEDAPAEPPPLVW